MSKLLKPLLTAAAFLTLAPATALALPPQCDDICPYSDSDRVCAIGSYVTTCGEYLFSAEQSSVTMNEETLVCSETQQSTSAES